MDKPLDALAEATKAAAIALELVRTDDNTMNRGFLGRVLMELGDDEAAIARDSNTPSTARLALACRARLVCQER